MGATGSTESSELGTGEPQVQQGSPLISQSLASCENEYGSGFVKRTNGGLSGCSWGAGYKVCSSWEDALSLRALTCTQSLCIFQYAGWHFDEKKLL